MKECLEDCAKVMVDYNYAPYKKKSKVDTGSFELIYKSKIVVEKPQAFGLNLCLEGKKIKI